jgi:hypothetical protein
VVGNAQVAAKPDNHGRRGHKIFLAPRAREARANILFGGFQGEKRVFYAEKVCQALSRKKIL